MKLNKTLLTLIFFIVTLFPNQASAIENKSPSFNIQTWASFDEKFPLDPNIETVAKQVNSHLNNPLFHTKFVLKPGAVRSYLMDKHCGQGIKQTCETEDGETIEYTYFNRNSDKLLVIGPGFTNPREFMAPFVGMFDCDIVIFDYRGHGYKPTKWYNPLTWKFNPAKIFFSIDGRKVKMGEVEHNDVIAVVEAVRKQKEYTQVTGLGICFSALIFIKAQSVYANLDCKEKTQTNLFDKIMCDGTWLSLTNQIERIKGDLKLMPNPQYGGWSKKWPVGEPWFSKLVQVTVEFVSRVPFGKLDVNILDYIPSVDIPLLFFHGKDDKFVPLDEFQFTWNHAVQAKQKVAFITSNPHVRSHLKQKELYKLLCDLFMELEFEDLLDCLQHPEKLVAYELEKYQKKLAFQG